MIFARSSYKVLLPLLNVLGTLPIFIMHRKYEINLEHFFFYFCVCVFFFLFFIHFCYINIYLFKFKILGKYSTFFYILYMFYIWILVDLVSTTSFLIKHIILYIIFYRKQGSLKQNREEIVSRKSIVFKRLIKLIFI